MPKAPLILGINSAYHESAAALLRGDEVVCAVEEERFTRVKHGKPARIDNPDALPWRAIEACLQAAGARLGDLDGVCYSLVPGLRQAIYRAYRRITTSDALGWFGHCGYRV